MEILQVTTEGLNEGFLSKKEFEFLNIVNPRTPVLYTLPKIHKVLPTHRVDPSFRAVGLFWNLLVSILNSS